MRRFFTYIAEFIHKLWDSKWRWVVIVLGLVLFFILWTIPLLFLAQYEAMNTFGELYAFGYILIPFYALAIWHVVSEDERDLAITQKIRSSLFIAFNKLLFALITFFLFVSIIGTLNGEL